MVSPKDSKVQKFPERVKGRLVPHTKKRQNGSFLLRKHHKLSSEDFKALDSKGRSKIRTGFLRKTTRLGLIRAGS